MTLDTDLILISYKFIIHTKIFFNPSFPLFSLPGIPSGNSKSINWSFMMLNEKRFNPMITNSLCVQLYKNSELNNFKLKIHNIITKTYIKFYIE